MATERDTENWRAKYPTGHAFTRAEIAAMEPDEFRYFQREIFDQQGTGLVRETTRRAQGAG
jgi:hypothetical protein